LVVVGAAVGAVLVAVGAAADDRAVPRFSKPQRGRRGDGAVRGRGRRKEVVPSPA
jgi:hypothetical protein